MSVKSSVTIRLRRMWTRRAPGTAPAASPVRPLRRRWLTVLLGTLAVGCTVATGQAMAAPDVALTASVDVLSPVTGQQMTLSIAAANIGAETANGVTVAVPLPAGVSAISSSATSGGFDPNTQVWTLGDPLAAGASATLTLRVSAANAGATTLTATAQVAADVNAANDTAEVVVRVRPALRTATCAFDSATNTRSCDLWATTTSVDLPGRPGVAVWTFTDAAAPRTDPVEPSGPAIVANDGETVVITLHNELGAPVALGIAQQALAPDTTGAPAGGTKTYTFTATTGTGLYSAGPTRGGRQQVAMGLAGALIVRPADAATAYGDATSAFDRESVLVLSELDPALNTSPDPAGFDMSTFSARYQLINGHPFPDVDVIPAGAGDRVLLRILNAGVVRHPMGVLGVRQTVVGADGQALPFAEDRVARTVHPGETLDAVVQVPADAPGGIRFPVYDTALRLDNDGATAPDATVPVGGILTTIEVPSLLAACAGPRAADVTAAAAPLDTVALRARVIACGQTTVAGFEYFVDRLGGEGTGAFVPALTAGVEIDMSTVVPAAIVAGLDGGHRFFVRSRGSDGTWGPVGADTLAFDRTGPATSSVVLTPSHPNASVPIAIGATASEVATGGHTVVAAELFVDVATPGTPGSGTPLTVTAEAVTVELTGSIPPQAEGAHTVTIRSRDALGNWGALTTAAFTVDAAGPATSAVTVTPNPNNGRQTADPNHARLVVAATLSDTGSGDSRVVRAEGFIGAVGAPGTGFPFIPSDGQFDSPSEVAYANVPLSHLNALAHGEHIVTVRALDAADNWGQTASTTLVIDRLPPIIAPLSVRARAGRNGTITVRTTVSDPAAGAPASTLTGAIVQIDRDDLNGTLPAVTADDGAFNSPTEAITAVLTTARMTNGPHVVTVRAKDAAGNLSRRVTATVVVRHTPLLRDGFERGRPAGWTRKVGTALTVSRAARLHGRRGLQARLGGRPAFLERRLATPTASYRARFRFAPNETVTSRTGHGILVGSSRRGTRLVELRYRSAGTGAGELQLRSAGTATAWTRITDAAHTIDVVWLGSAGTADLYIDGTRRESLTRSATREKVVRVAFGPSIGVTRRTSGVEYFDRFMSWR